ncbi:MAG: hypothetical protein IJ343_13130 [Clostridia bacterium]|nr:hypothetical protein [Clostridia bacterium]
MLPQDCIVETGKDGKKARYVISETGRKYQIGKKFGEGGVGVVFLVIAADGPQKGQKFVLKEYRPPDGDPVKTTQQRNIRKNLERLIKEPIKDDDGSPLKSMVPPIEMIKFPQTGSFGYIMNYVELKDFVSVGKLRKMFPPADVICKLCYGISHFFVRLASASGLCYKDINEGNIYLNPQTGEVRVIDNDNVGLPSTRTISGTDFYMAPEVLMGLNDPDAHTDRFQLATYILRMLLFARPYDGPKAAQYMDKNNKTAVDAAPVIYGSNATFIFDPDDRTNSVRLAKLPLNATDEEKKQHNGWMNQTQTWDRLPPVLQENFIRTFAKSCKPANRQGRTTAQKWQKTFLDLQQTIVTCPKCKTKTFGAGTCCFYCGTKFKTVSCKNCGKQTPLQHTLCIHCGKAWNSVVATVKCPHCQKENPSSEQRCKQCGKFIRVVCRKCGTLSSGDVSHCPKCRTPLFLPCPSCRKQLPLDEATCVYCRTPLPQEKIKCSGCKRVNTAWHTKCIECGQPLSAAAAATQQTIVRQVRVKLRINGIEQSHSFRYQFGSGQVVYADDLNSTLPHQPLFELKYHRTKQYYVLLNLSGGPIQHRAANMPVAVSAAAGAQIVLSFTHVFKFSDALQFKLEAIDDISQ